MHRFKTSLALATTLALAVSAFAQKPETIDAAEKGDVTAQIKLGHGFRDGKFGKKDHQKSFGWFS